MKYKLILLLTLLLSGCNTNETPTHTTQKAQAKTQERYVNFDHFKEGRPCAEVKFMCLPESQDKSWQSVPTKDHIEDLALTPEVEKRYKDIAQDWNKKYDDYYSKPHPKGEKKPMLITSLDKDLFDKVDKRRFLEKMEQSLEKEFPGFWREVAKPIRYRWIRRAMNKAKKFGGDPKQNNSIVELCARIGLDFDLDPKWDYIVSFIKKDFEDNIDIATDYIDWTIFNKAHSRSGTRITDWLMRDASRGLPTPKKPYPKLND